MRGDEITLVCKPGKVQEVMAALDAIAALSGDAYVEASRQFTSAVTRVVEHAHVLTLCVDVVAARSAPKKPLDEDDCSREDFAQRYEGVQAGP